MLNYIKNSYLWFVLSLLFFTTSFLVIINVLNYQYSWDLLWEWWKYKHINNIAALEQDYSTTNFALVSIHKKDSDESYEHYIWLKPNWDVIDDSYSLEWNIFWNIISPSDKETVEILFYQIKKEWDNWYIRYSNSIFEYLIWIYWFNIHNLVYRIWYWIKPLKKWTN